jgi:hypothetical protein
MPELIPFRWPASWKDSSKLDLLKGTPINCLAGEAPPPFAVPDLPFIKLDAGHPPEGIALRQGVWPRVLASTKKENADAGPTGGPWVDSNAWVVRLTRVMEPGKTVWLTHVPPGGNEVVPLDSFVKPIAEAEAFGAHWVIAPDEYFAGQLERRNEKALAEWNRMMAALRFFEGRREWRQWDPVAPLAVISTFEGEGKLLSEEFLNLAPRRHLAYHVLRPADVPNAPLAKRKAAIYLETEPPDGTVRARLLEFAQAGGLLIAPPGTVDAPAEERRSEHTLRRAGKGRVAMPLEKWDDPFVLVDQVHVLLSHREDPLQLWNAPDMDTYYLADPKEERAVVHLVPYASGRTPRVTLGLQKRYRRARIHTLGTGAGPRTVTPVNGQLGIEIAVPEFADYAAVELEA